MLAFGLQQYEPVGWAEELLPAAVAANLTQLPRLYTAASFCTFLGRPEDAVGYAHAAVRLQDDPGYEPFTDGLAAYQEAQAHLYSWRIDRYLEICTGLAEQTGLAYVLGLCGMTVGLTGVGRSDDAIAIAADTMTAARAHANPFLIAYAYFGSGMAYTEKDPHRALDALREALAYTRQHSAPLFEALIARDAAGLEAAHGDIDQALDMFTVSIDSFHQSGDTTNLAVMFAHLMAFFDRAGRSEIAATFYGITTTNSFSGFATAVDHLRNILDTDTFDTCARSGAAMTTTESVYYARQRIDETRRQRT
jgi:tetratricopeptide (TPR) repeat protein